MSWTNRNLATPTLSMKCIRELLRQKWVCNLKHRDIAANLGISAGSVSVMARRATEVGLDWDLVTGLSDAELTTKLKEKEVNVQIKKPLPDYSTLHFELARPCVTLELLHQEYKDEHADGYAYSQFCTLYRRWRKSQRRSLRVIHVPGEKMFVDFSGTRPQITDKQTGEKHSVELFVAILGASDYTYAQAIGSQKIDDWLTCHENALRYFGGTPKIWVPDQLKSAVVEHCRYEPGIQRTYRELAEHHGATVVPARPYKPKDKSKAELAVQIVQRWILAKIRKETFYSLADLNLRIGELLDELNHRVTKSLGASRRQLFERLDRKELKPTNLVPFARGAWLSTRIREDYHIKVDGHYYSVPNSLVGEKVDIRVSVRTIEVFHGDHRVVSHPRSTQQGQKTTQLAHMPESHRQHMQWTPERLRQWASVIGHQVGVWVDTVLKEPRPLESRSRTCLGLLRLCEQFDPIRVERACERALELNMLSYRRVRLMLANGLEADAESESDEPLIDIYHENLRGPQHYQ